MQKTQMSPGVRSAVLSQMGNARDLLTKGIDVGRGLAEGNDLDIMAMLNSAIVDLDDARSRILQEQASRGKPTE